MLSRTYAPRFLHQAKVTCTIFRFISTKSTKSVKSKSNRIKVKKIRDLPKIPVNLESSEALSEDIFYSAYNPLVTPLIDTPIDYHFLKMEPVIKKEKYVPSILEINRRSARSVSYIDDLDNSSIPDTVKQVLINWHSNPPKPGQEQYRYDKILVEEIKKKELEASAKNCKNDDTMENKSTNVIDVEDILVKN